MPRMTRTVLAALLGALAAGADGHAETAREILDRVRALDDTTRRWTDRTQKMTMRAFDAAGAERRREFVVYTKRADGGEEKALSFFLGPAEVKGTGFLQWAHRNRDDEQWLYLPEFRRTRQIAARLRDESFMGTDFSYRDLGILAEMLRWGEEEAPARLRGDEAAGGAACAVIEMRPRDEGSSYEHLVLWLERERLVPRRLNLHDRGGTLVKTLAMEDVRDVRGIPTPHRFEMRTVAKGSRTEVEVSEVAYDSGLGDEVFTQRYLERGGL